MKPIRLSMSGREGLERFIEENGDSRGPEAWKSFRYHDGGTSFKALKRSLYKNQRGLCAYCEIDLLSPRGIEDQEIEHFHPKRDIDGQANRTFSVDNLFLSCFGGVNHGYFPIDRSPERNDRHPAPGNKSCGAHKEDFEKTIPHCDRKWFYEGLLRPTSLPDAPPIFSVSFVDGSIDVNASACTANGIDPAKVAVLIDVFNLNCLRLRGLRLAHLEVLSDTYNRNRDDIISSADIDTADDASIDLVVRRRVSEELFTPLPHPADPSRLSLFQFFTTSRNFLGQEGEAWLASNKSLWLDAEDPV